MKKIKQHRATLEQRLDNFLVINEINMVKYNE